MPHRVPKEMTKLAELIGNFIQYWGFKKIHGQIWAYVYVSKDPIDATTMVKRLGVSKALVSLAIKDLLKYKVIQIAGKGTRRKILFQSNPDIAQVIANVLRQREKVMLAELATMHKNLDQLDWVATSWDVNPARVREIGHMIETADGALEYLITANLVTFSTEAMKMLQK